MRRYWWWFRLGVFCIVFIGLGLFLFNRTPWRKWMGADYSADIARGDKIVHAVEQFRSDCGLWPQYLEDLVPHYLAEVADPGNDRHWFYELSPAPDDEAASGFRTVPSLSVATGDLPREHVGYDFDERSPAWELFGSGSEVRILRRDAAHGAATAPSGERLTRALAELDRRIAREPRELEHRRAKAGLLLGTGRLAEAGQVVKQALEDFPDSYWPRMAEVLQGMPAAMASLPPATAPATSAAPTGRGERLKAFAQWVAEHPTMTHWFYLSHLQRLSDEPDAAAQSMARAAEQPIEVAPDDPNIPAYYLWDMARWAFETRRFDLATQICDTWEVADKEKRVADASYLPIRAAIRLAQGNLPGARGDLEALDGPPERRSWARNVEGPKGLREAIAHNDRAYRYHPGALPAGYNAFGMPE